MRILVTGGAGFIDSNFIHYVINNHPDDHVICVDSLTYAGNLHNLDGLNSSRISFHKVDITDAEAIDNVFAQELPEIVINFAAESHVDRSIENPGIFLSTNIQGTNTLLLAAKKYHVKRYHQISTDEVYGDLPLDRPDLLFREDTPINPSSPYSVSKAAADMLVTAFERTYGLPVSISRCSNNYGPYHFPEKLIPLVISNAKANRPIPVYGKGENVRDWLYVEDHCSAIDLIIRAEQAQGKIYNIGGHNEIQNIEIVKTVLNLLGKSEDLITFVTDRAGHDLRYAIDNSKIMRELGWSPKYTFEQGIRKTIEWYNSNGAWLERIVSGEYQDYYNRMYYSRH